MMRKQAIAGKLWHSIVSPLFRSSSSDNLIYMQSSSSLSLDPHSRAPPSLISLSERDRIPSKESTERRPPSISRKKKNGSIEKLIASIKKKEQELRELTKAIFKLQLEICSNEIIEREKTKLLQ